MGLPRRRQVLRAIGTGAAMGLAGCTRSDGSDPSPTTGVPTDAVGTVTPDDSTPTGEPTATTSATAPDTVGLESVVEGLQAPVGISFAPDADRAYLLEQQGLVVRVEAGELADDPALDLRDAVTAGGERGLLGIALHPGFADNRRVFLRYSAPRRSGTPQEYSHTFVLSEFRATEDGTAISRDTERTLLEIPEPQGNHNAGDIAFGPDGYLYVTVGDGGAAGDRGTGHVDDWYDAVAGGNGQDVTENLLGSLLRIDVDGTDGDRPYAIPDDNPLVGGAGLDEHYAWGFRNPWRLSFDRDGRLFVADVGQNRYEEVNLVERGGNYGWNVKEATHCYGADSCPDATPDAVRGGEPLVDPVIEYPNARHQSAPVSGSSVIGGHVYHGSAIPGLTGTYVFGDLRADGRLFAATPADGGGLWPTRVLAIADDDADKLGRLFTIGRDREDELYTLGVGRRGGSVFRVVQA